MIVPDLNLLLYAHKRSTAQHIAALDWWSGLMNGGQIAALTMEYRGTLHSADNDFARMPGLRWRNPL